MGVIVADSCVVCNMEMKLKDKTKMLQTRILRPSSSRRVWIGFTTGQLCLQCLFAFLLSNLIILGVSFLYANVEKNKVDNGGRSVKT